MPVRNRRGRIAYGLSEAEPTLSPQPIISQRAPLSNDFAEIGTLWIDVPNDDSYILTSIVANVASWINAGGGTGTFNNLTVANVVTFESMGIGMLRSDVAGVIDSITGTDGQVIVGATGAAPIFASLISDGSISFTLGANSLDIRTTGAAASTFPGDSGIATPILGATMLTGGLNITTVAAGGDVTFNLDAGPSIAGGITITSGTTTITSDTNSADAIYLHADGGINETIRLHADQGTSADSINLLSDDGGITLQSVGFSSDDAINIEADAGGIDLNAALQINISSAEAAVDAVLIASSNAAGGIDMDTGTGGFDLVSTGAVSIDGAATSNFSVTGAGIDLELDSAAGRVIINAEEAANNAITISSSAGGLDVDVALQMNLTSSQAAATAISLDASNASGGITLNTGPTPGVTLNNGTQTAQILTGSGSPDTAVTAVQGSMYLRTDGTIDISLYINTDGAMAWTALTST